MPQLNRQIAVFKEIFSIRSDFRKEKKIFTLKKSLSFGFFELDWDWLELAIKFSRDQKRRMSHPEFYSDWKNTPCTRIVNGMNVEVISAGKTVVLLVNTCPVAQIDLKGEVGMAEFFDLPAMTKEEWELWELLGASTCRFEIQQTEEDLILSQVKREEGQLNVLEMKWNIKMRNGDSTFDVSSARHTLPKEPTIENLMDWIEVRVGKSDASVLNEKR